MPKNCRCTSLIWINCRITPDSTFTYSACCRTSVTSFTMAATVFVKSSALSMALLPVGVWGAGLLLDWGACIAASDVGRSWERGSGCLLNCLMQLMRIRTHLSHTCMANIYLLTARIAFCSNYHSLWMARPGACCSALATPEPASLCRLYNY